MKQLKETLDNLEGIGQRKQLHLITDLIPSINQAQENGYTLAVIHEEIAKVIPIAFTTFKTTYYRIKKKSMEEDQAKLEQPEN